MSNSQMPAQRDKQSWMYLQSSFQKQQQHIGDHDSNNGADDLAREQSCSAQQEEVEQQKEPKKHVHNTQGFGSENNIHSYTIFAVTSNEKSVSGSLLSKDFVSEIHEELRQRRRRFGSFHPKVAESLSSLGLYFHHIMQDTTESLRCHNEAYRVLNERAKYEDVMEHATINKPLREELLISMAIVKTDIGSVHRTCNDFRMAFDCYNEALRIFRLGNAPSYHPALQSALRGLDKLEPYSKDSTPKSVA
mmetsp:Transcript_5108/g.6935  ORF Transcript_5108/g.6935 Transcript_5108/m.6935 type:complete len:248 (+) Transcript_5108:64-807(+)|eukprot:CAMPEP_0116062446 /NCGR_PEP_ID=MMETSP0322-20121206/7763_1 /TAXON_ID=163516 /ORGANISM="Leptocylindrus danicus var. apora, Strain B651" /LENGTH=247 /DNA_ID=CAMNT_0003547753 /DNA_START=50 /DNA_END=793 /DNA_ORIENTATION=+